MFLVYINKSRKHILSPKIPCKQKLVNCYLGSLYEEFIYFFNFFFWTSKLHILQAFWDHQARPISTPYEPMVKFCSKWVLCSFFLYFFKSSHVAKTAQGLKGRVLRKKFVLPIESWLFIIFLLMVLHDVTFNVIATIQI
jgi:hypothetical protein